MAFFVFATGFNPLLYLLFLNYVAYKLINVSYAENNPRVRSKVVG